MVGGEHDLIGGELDLVGGEFDQVESMWGRTRWGRTRHGAKPAATVDMGNSAGERSSSAFRLG